MHRITGRSVGQRTRDRGLEIPMICAYYFMIQQGMLNGFFIKYSLYAVCSFYISFVTIVSSYLSVQELADVVLKLGLLGCDFSKRLESH